MTVTTTSEGILPQQRKIVVALDGSDEGFYALKWTLEHLLTDRDLLVLLTVQQSPSGMSSVFIASATQSAQLDQARLKIMARGKGMIERWNAGMAAATTVESGLTQGQGGEMKVWFDGVSLKAKDVREAICTFCRGRVESSLCSLRISLPLSIDGHYLTYDNMRPCLCKPDQNADILILGSRGLSAIKKAFVGSVSEYCVHHVGCPVIVVRNKSEQGKMVSEATVVEGGGSGIASVAGGGSSGSGTTTASTRSVTAL